MRLIVKLSMRVSSKGDRAVDRASSGWELLYTVTKITELLTYTDVLAFNVYHHMLDKLTNIFLKYIV